MLDSNLFPVPSNLFPASLFCPHFHRFLDAGLRSNRRGLRRLARLFYIAITRSPELQERFGFLVQALAFVVVEDRLSHNAVDLLWTEVVLVVETVDHLHHVIARQAGILDVGHLMPAGVDHGLGVDDETVLFGEIVELGSGISVSDRNLNGLAVERLGEIDGVANGLARLARQSQNEIGMDDEAKLVAVAGKVARTLDRRALLDVLQNLRIA